MSLAEGVQARVAYKAYSTGLITSNVQPVSSVDPDGSTGGQILRRTSASLKLAKDTYQSAEIRSDRQVGDYRHGTKRVSGSVSGEYSPGTYFDMFEAACRGTKAVAITASQSDFTSVAADHASSTFIFGAGNPVTKGFRVGMIMRFGGMSDTDNNAKNFVITGFSGGGTNRTVAVFPAPDTMTADTSFTVASVGKSVIVPSSGFVSRKFGFEVYHSDIDLARLYTECRIAGFNLNLPASGLATTEFPVMGRDMEIYTGADAPFYVDPTAETTTGIFAAVNGLLRVGGTNVGVITGLQMQMQLSPTSDPVVGQNFVPEIFLGKANLTGQMTAFLEDGTYLNDFKNETELNLLAYLTTTSDVNSPASTLYVPRLKLSDADVPTQGEGGQQITMPFQALKYQGSGAGIAQTTFQLCDSEAV